MHLLLLCLLYLLHLLLRLLHLLYLLYLLYLLHLLHLNLIYLPKKSRTSPEGLSLPSRRTPRRHH